jgi:hypothetical protein
MTMKAFMALLILALYSIISDPPISAEDVLSRQDLCKGIQNYYECSKRIEDIQLPLLKGKVRRLGAKLTLTLKDGRIVSREDSPGEFKSFNDSSEKPNRLFTFSEYIEKQGYYLLEAHYYEGGSFELINFTTGASVAILDTPVFAPDGRRFFVVSADDDSITNEMQVWTITPASAQKEWTYKPKNWPWVIAKWTDSSTIDVYYRNGSKERGAFPAKFVAQIKKGKDGNWIASEKNQ